MLRRAEKRVASETSGMIRSRYAEYLRSAGGETYQEAVFDYIDREDSPRPVTYQTELMRRVGFRSVDILHRNSCFAAFGGAKKIGVLLKRIDALNQVEFSKIPVARVNSTHAVLNQDRGEVGVGNQVALDG